MNLRKIAHFILAMILVFSMFLTTSCSPKSEEIESEESTNISESSNIPNGFKKVDFDEEDKEDEEAQIVTPSTSTEQNYDAVYGDAYEEFTQESEEENDDSDSIAAPILVEQEEKQIEGTKYVINTNSGKFHYDWCSSVRQMKESNKQYFTGTRDTPIAWGYVPCKRCNP